MDTLKYYNKFLFINTVIKTENPYVTAENIQVGHEFGMLWCNSVFITMMTIRLNLEDKFHYVKDLIKIVNFL